MPDRELDGPGTLWAAEVLYCRFAEMGYKVHDDDFFDMGGEHQVNVVADPPNAKTSPAPFLITAHYDSVSPRGEPATGADDNGSGITVMLDQAHRLAQQGFPHPVSFVGFGAEEPGLLGSTAFASRLKANKADLRAVVNLDSVGIPNEGQYFINGDSRSRWIYLDMVKVSTDEQQLV
jgi:Zn-dependent M28 family amino/carboxypeptidase